MWVCLCPCYYCPVEASSPPLLPPPAPCPLPPALHSLPAQAHPPWFLPISVQAEKDCDALRAELNRVAAQVAESEGAAAAQRAEVKQLQGAIAEADQVGERVGGCGFGEGGMANSVADRGALSPDRPATRPPACLPALASTTQPQPLHAGRPRPAGAAEAEEGV